MSIPTYDDILSALSAAAAGDQSARVSVPADTASADPAVRLAVAVNLLLSSFAAQTAELAAARQALQNVDADRQALLRQSEEKFSRAFRASPAAISIASLPEGRWIEINDALVALSGYSREEALGKTSAELGILDAEARAKVLQAIAEHGMVRDVEIQVRTKTGHLVDVLVSVEQVEINGQPCALTIQYDITERKRAEREVRRLNADLEQRQAALEVANQDLEAFSYSVAHDLRAPLRSIDGYSLALLEDYADKVDADGQQALRRVRASAQAMGRLIDDLLKLAQITRTELRREPVDLTAMARAVLARLADGAPERQVAVQVAGGLRMETDPHLLGILLENLLGNAWKFTGKRPAARIEVGVETQDGGPVYFVRDNGAGFNMAYADKLFAVFQRLHTDQDFQGTGLGLAICQRIVTRQGGRIWAHSAPDQGATFYFTL